MKKLLLSLCLVVGFFSQSALFAQPANDNCADASPISEGTNQMITTVDATTDGSDHAGADNCESGGTTPAVTYNDVWYMYTSTITGQVEWSLCGSVDFDSKIYVYNGSANCPPTDTDILACNEDAGACANSSSLITFDVVAGESYLLRVGGYGDGAPGASGSGTFSITEYIPAPTPDNDDCADATVISYVMDYEFDNNDATTDGPEHPGNPCFGFGDNTVQTDIWYSFTAPQTGSVEWSTCNLTTLDTRMAVYTGAGSCPYTDGDLYGCNDDGGGCADFTSMMIFDVTEGETYLLRLGGYNGTDGMGTMNLIDIIPPEPPLNDLCTDASDVPYVMTRDAADALDDFFSGSTIASTFDSDQFIFPECIGNTNGGEFGDVWFTFNTEGNTELEFRMLTETPMGEYYIDLWENCDTFALDDNIMGDCMYLDGTTLAGLYVDTIMGLPPVDTEYLMRIITRFTSDIPGDFWFQLVGENTSAVEELAVEELLFFPNPAADQATLKFNLLESGTVDFEITNILGERLYQENKGTLSSGNYNFPITLSNFDPGVYMLSIRMDEKVKTMKFIKE
jgi:hypothetical protein